jgi:type I restriction enzyme S subunit
MIDDLKPYPEYKESGLPWLGQVPEHWKLVPNRGLVRKRKLLVGDRHKEYQLLSLTKQGVIVRDISTGKGKFSSDMGTSQEVRRGDLVFCLFDVPETPRTVGLALDDGMITGAYTVFESLGNGNSKYFELFYLAMDDRKLLSPLYSGLRNTIPAERFLGTKSPLPPPEEQAAIVRFLNWSTGRLERAIRAKRKVIALLNEQKQAIIHRAVTRGLDPEVSLKPSGILWLGDVPVHWEIKRIKYLMQTVDRRSATGSEVLLSMRKYHGLVPYHEHFHKPPQAATLKGFKLVKPGQVVVNRMQAGFGLVFSSTYDGLVSPDFGVFQPTGEVVPAFLGELFRSRDIRAQFQRESKGLGTGKSGFMRLYDDRIGIVHIAFPPSINEQQMILNQLREDVRGVDNTIRITEQEIALLLEFRTTLTAEVVTGKIDVRRAVASLPDEAPPDTSPDDDLDLTDAGEIPDDEADS